MDGLGERRRFTVAAVDNDPMCLTSIAHLIETEVPQARLLWTAEKGATAVEIALRPEMQPNVLLVDMSMEDMPGLMVCQRIRRSTDRVALLAMTSFSLKLYADDAWRSGAQGIVSKGSNDELIRGLVTVANGGTYGEGGFETAPLSHYRLASVPLSRRELLTDKESQVLNLLAEGLEDDDIAEQMQVGRDTVRKHLQKAKQKLGVRNRIQMVLRWAGRDRDGGHRAL